MTAHRHVAACFTDDARPRDGHEAATLLALARRIAALHGLPFEGESCDGGRAFLVPDMTLLAEDAERLGVHGADDLFGGVVPHAFIATKLVSHPAVGRRSQVPDGWSHDLAGRLADAVLPGFSVFDRASALDAYEQLAPLGRVRFKLARGIGGNGQHLVDRREALAAVLDALPADELERHGASLEQDLQAATTYSIGVVECARQVIAYHGTQHTTRGAHGHDVYGGSDLVVVRGGLEALLAALDDEADAPLRRAVDQAAHYDAAMIDAFPGFFASRRNYDVVRGLDANGEPRSGVLEQSWRIGGASPAELLAMEAFARDPALARIETSCHEVYGPCTPPDGAVVHYRGEDPRLGPLTKYAMHGHTPRDAAHSD